MRRYPALEYARFNESSRRGVYSLPLGCFCLAVSVSVILWAVFLGLRALVLLVPKWVSHLHF